MPSRLKQTFNDLQRRESRERVCVSMCLCPDTRCDAAHLRWDVLKDLRCIKITCDVLRCIFQHVGNFSPDFGISLRFIVRFSNGLDHCDGHLIGFHMIHIPTFSVKYF